MKKISVAIAICLMVVSVFALTSCATMSYKVYSGSMEPNIPSGSTVYCEKVDPEDLQVGDIITYMLNEELKSTHRIVDITIDEDGTYYFTTKGDANSENDYAPVHEANVLGRVVRIQKPLFK